MKTLREYILNLGTAGHDQEHAGITWGGSFNPPIHGTVNGLPVRILQSGDLPGASTVLMCADPSGFLGTVKQVDVVVTDGAYLPLRDSPPIAQSMR